jgi:hypothetical protein
MAAIVPLNNYVVVVEAITDPIKKGRFYSTDEVHEIKRGSVVGDKSQGKESLLDKEVFYKTEDAISLKFNDENLVIIDKSKLLAFTYNA